LSAEEVLAVYKVLLFSLILSSALSISSAQETDLSLLTGNWHITGGPELSQFPTLDITLGNDGATIYGEGHLKVECSKYKIGQDIFVVGKIAPDGTFELVNNPPRSLNKITIHGSVPIAPESRDWRGRFTVDLKSHEAAGCSPAQGDIVAKPFPPLNGVFSGTVEHGEDFGAHISLEISQGPLIAAQRANFEPFSHCVALNAKLTISDSSRFPAGVFTTDGNSLPRNCNSRMSGDDFEQFFSLPDGSTLQLSGGYHYIDLDRLVVMLYDTPKDPKNETKVLDARLTRQ
jgi:hypothetical protein